MIQRLRQIFLLPAAAVMILLFFVPLLIVFFYSLLSRGAYGGVILPFTLEVYGRVFDPLYLTIAFRSFWIAAVSTLLCLVLGFPLALYIARYSQRKTLLLNLVMLPFWTSFLIRIYAWMFLLRDTGLINTLLLATHIISAPLPLLFNTPAVILGLVYGYLPFTVLPLYATIEKLDPAWLDAAADLGANPLVATWKIIIPLSRPGIVAGTLLVFIPCLGAYLAPDLMGGGKTVMIGNLVQNQFTASRDWPFGAALSLLLMLAVLVITAAVSRKAQDLI
jgi:spermidine/putrescine transport system permease protein